MNQLLGWVILAALVASEGVVWSAETKGFDLTVRAPDGTAVTNVLLWIFPKDAPSSFHCDWKFMITDSKGEVAFRTTSGVERISLELARVPNDTLPYFGKSCLNVPVIDKDKGPQRLELMAAKCSTVEGVLIDPDGKPVDIEGALVNASGLSYPEQQDGKFQRSTVTGPGGRFRFPPIPSTNRVTVGTFDQYTMSLEQPELEVTLGHAFARVKVVRQHAAAISLWKREENGGLVAFTNWPGLLEYECDDRLLGGGSVLPKKGRVDVWARPANRYRFRMPLSMKHMAFEDPVVDLPSKDPEIRLVIGPRPRLADTVVEVVEAGTGKAIAGAKVQWRVLDDYWMATTSSTGVASMKIKTMEKVADMSGRASLSLQHAATYAVNSSGYVGIEFGNTRLLLGQTNRVELKADELMSGCITAADGKPVTNGVLTLKIENREERNGRIEGDGQFAISVLGLKGSGVLMVEAPGYVRGYLPVKTSGLGAKVSVQLEVGVEVHLEIKPSLRKELDQNKTTGSLVLLDPETRNEFYVVYGWISEDGQPLEQQPGWVKPGRYDLYMVTDDVTYAVETFDICRPGRIQYSAETLKGLKTLSTEQFMNRMGYPYRCK